VSGLDGRVALVVGGTSGIGAATASLLRDGGATVVVADLHASDGDEAVDVTDGEAVDELVAGLGARHGRLDIAVNAAGVAGTYATVAESDPAAWDRTIAVNLTGVYRCTRAELAVMVPAGSGAIVNVASAAGAIGVPGLAAYSASKHGVVGLTRSAALEVARSGVRVNAVLPGSTRTPMLSGFAGDDAALERMGRATPIGRLAEPAEVARAIVWLASDDSSFVTGEALAVDGGALAT
jgi:NAD(P)-dependent dehydrogenase (short-subunit alcohol dehydrogenase family)